MSLAIKFGDPTDPSSVSGAVYFDAVTDFKKDWSGRVTEHPIEAGASITDHFVSNNPKIKIKGVISHVDFSSIPQTLSLDGEPVLNSNARPDAVQVGNLGSVLRNVVPASISQFLPNISPNVIVDGKSRTNHKDSIELMMREMLNGLYFNQERQRWENRMTTTILYEIIGGSAANPIQDLVVTSFDVDETVETGSALFVDMTLEQVRFVTLEKAEAPKAQRGSATARATASTKNKGNANSTPVDLSSPTRSPTAMDKVRDAHDKFKGG